MDKLEKPLETWREELSDEQFQVCRLGATERPFSGKYNDTKAPGIYHCACCDAPLFDSDAKFDTGCGWPSYFAHCCRRLNMHILVASDHQCLRRT